MAPSAFLVLLGLGCSDNTIKTFTEPPSVTITTPGPEQEVDQSVPTVLQGMVTDSEFSSSLSSLTAIWQVGGMAICDESVIDDGGNIECIYAFEDSGTQTLRLTVTNPDGATATAEHDIIVVPNSAPTASITAPEPGSDQYAGELIAFEALVEDGEDNADDLVAYWVSSIDGELDVDSTPTSAGGLSGATTLSEGEHLITLTVTDSTGLTGEDTLIVNVGAANSPPDCAILSPENNDSFELGATVLFEGTATDADVGSSMLDIEWKSNIDGVLSTDSPTSSGGMSFAAAGLSQGTHTITLTVTDEVGADCSDAILVTMGSGPDIEILDPTTGTTFNDGDSVAFSAFVTDSDDSATSLDITWESSRDGELSTEGADSSGTIEFSTRALSVGEHTITVTATDPDGFYGNDSIRLTINGVPTTPGVTITPDPATSNDDLVANLTTTSTDPEGDPVSYIYAWYRNGTLTSYSTEEVPASATSSGDTWRVQVTATDGTGTSEAGTDSVDIGNSAPTLASVSITPTSPVEGNTLTCVPSGGVDPDGDTVVYSYRWSVNGTATGTTGSTLTSSYFNRDDSVTCTVTPSDGTDTGDSVTSDPVTIGNTAPVLTTVTLSPTTAYEATTLTCSPGSASDADSDTISYSYDWLVNSTRLGLDSATLTGSWFDKTDTVVCEVTPTDDADEGTPVESNTVTIRNTLPVVASATLTPTSPSESSTLYCSAGATSDDDGDTVTVSYGWLVNGAAISVTSTSLTGSYFDRGDTVNCTVTPNDGTGAGTTVTSSTVTIGNTAPTLTSVSLSPLTPYTDDNIVATPSGGADTDGDSVSYSYAWYINDTLSTATGSTLSYTRHEKHDEIYVVVTPSDGTDSGASVTSATVTVENTAPTAPVVSITPVDAEPEDDLVCNITSSSTDLDGDSVTYVYSWSMSGVSSGITDSTLDFSYTEDGDSWTCTVMAYDGEDYSTAASDSQAVVDRTAPDQPIISSIDPYRNETVVDVDGTAEAGSTVTVTMDCSDGTYETESEVVASDGSWDVSFTAPAGVECDFWAVAEDATGNVSDESNVVTTETCDPTDDYEDVTGYGDTCAESIDDWDIVADDGTTISVVGNIVDTTDEDWFVFETSQSVLTAGTNLFNFEVTMVEGTAEYAFAVYRGDCGDAALECDDGTGEGDGWTEYGFYAQDTTHSLSDSRYCYTGSPFYNNCDDLSGIYYVHVWRTTTDLSCGHYELEVSNGAW